MINKTERREWLLAFEVARESKSTAGLSQCQLLLGAVHCRRYLCFPRASKLLYTLTLHDAFRPCFIQGFSHVVQEVGGGITLRPREKIYYKVIRLFFQRQTALRNKCTSSSSFGESNWFYLINSKFCRTVSYQQAKSFAFIPSVENVRNHHFIFWVVRDYKLRFCIVLVYCSLTFLCLI